MRGRGTVPMRALREGDEVYTRDGTYEPVLCWLHRHEAELYADIYKFLFRVLSKLQTTTHGVQYQTIL